jgi:four helix bundle protein
MASIKRFEEIEAWKTARELTNYVYALCREGALGRDFGLRDQLCRAAVSVMSNIAEGFEDRRSESTFLNYLAIAKGSAGEVRSLLYVALDCGYITQQQFDEASEHSDKCSRQLYNFMKYIKR